MRGCAMRKRLSVILAAAVVAGLIPVAAIAKPKPPEPPPEPWPPCVFVDGTLQDYTGGNYNCMWRPEAGTNWDITVTPEGAAVSITLAVKDDQTSAGGDLCLVMATDPPADRNADYKPQWSRVTTAVTATYALPDDGDCHDPYGGEVIPGDPDEFTLFVDTVPGRNPVSVTVDTVDQLP
jgi:hypothetical protein